MSKTSSIEISPKYGLNPSQKICLFCGEPKEIIFFGRIREKDANGRSVPNSDVKAPVKILLDIEPCEKCLETHKNSLFVAEVDKTPTNVFVETSENVNYYATGRSFIYKGLEEKGSRVCCMEKEEFDKVYREV